MATLIRRLRSSLPRPLGPKRVAGLRSQEARRQHGPPTPAATGFSPRLKRLGDGVRAFGRPRAISGEPGGRSQAISDGFGRPRASSAGPVNVGWPSPNVWPPSFADDARLCLRPRVGTRAGRRAAGARPTTRRGPGAATDRGPCQKRCEMKDNSPEGRRNSQKKKEKPPAFGRRLLFS